MRTYWDKPGGSREQFERDSAECQAIAYRELPPLQPSAPQRGPSTYTANCNGDSRNTNCIVTQQSDFNVYTDPVGAMQEGQAMRAREDGRNAMATNCLFSKGYVIRSKQ